MVVPLSGAGHLRVTHPFATLTLRRVQEIPFDLHALGTPLAFILSQDQTLRRKFNICLSTDYIFSLTDLNFAVFLSLFNCQSTQGFLVYHETDFCQGFRQPKSTFILVLTFQEEKEKRLLAMTYSPRGSPPKYHRRWRT